MRTNRALHIAVLYRRVCRRNNMYSSAIGSFLPDGCKLVGTNRLGAGLAC